VAGAAEATVAAGVAQDGLAAAVRAGPRYPLLVQRHLSVPFRLLLEFGPFGQLQLEFHQRRFHP